MINQVIDTGVKYQEGRAKEILSYYAQLYEANWLLAFMPGTRPADKEFEILNLDFSDWIGEESFHHLSPKVIGLYETVYSRQGEGMGFDYFIKGAVAIANLFPDPSLLAGFFQGQLELMTEVTEYPLIVDRYIQDYVDIIEAIMLGDERTTWKQMLAYNAGVYWMMSLVRPESMYNGFQQHIRRFMLDRAKRGVIEQL
jgi:hypothetical protein